MPQLTAVGNPLFYLLGKAFIKFFGDYVYKKCIFTINLNIFK